MAETSATAEGEFAKTPFAHLLVYALDRRLSGVLFLKQPDGVEHVVRLARGAPVKVRPGDRHALLGEMLVEAGAIDAETLESALATKGLLGDMLLLAGRVDGDVLESIAEEQFVRRMVRLFSLPPATVYRYFDGHDELAEYGGDPASVDPLCLLWAGLRAHGELSTMMPATLALLGEAPIRLHAAATVSRFDCTEQEAKLLEHLSAWPASLGELDALGHVPAEVVRRFAYALMITRQLDLGTGTTPLGAGSPAPDPDASRPPLLPQPPAGASVAAVARLKIRSTVHRVGAAAPDLPGDGERGPATFAPRRARPPEGERPSGPAQAPPPKPPPLPEPEAADEAPATQPSSSGTREVTVQAPVPVDGDTERDSGVMPAEPARHAAGPTLRSPSDDPPAPAPAADPLAGLSLPELLERARDRLSERDPRGAIAACESAGASAPDDPDVVALGSWARSQLGGADLKALTVALDEMLNAHEAHVEGRFYRALLRKRLGDEAGATRDLRHVLELVPGHEGATRELASFEAKQKAKERPSLFGRLFKR